MPGANKTGKRTKLLKTAFDRIKKQNPLFSLRALAKKIDVSPAFLSKVFSGKSDLPLVRAQALAKHLKMDKISEDALLKTYLDPSLLNLAPTNLKKAEKEFTFDPSNAVEAPEKFHFLISNWYYLAILDLTLCEEFSSDPSWISNKLGISKDSVSSALKDLKLFGFLKEEAGVLKKTDAFLRFPAIESKTAIRKFHEQLLNKAIETMKTKVSKSDYAERLVNGVIVPANPQQIERVKERLSSAMLEVFDLLQEGPKTQLFYLGNVLFPLSRPTKIKQSATSDADSDEANDETSGDSTNENPVSD